MDKRKLRVICVDNDAVAKTNLRVGSNRIERSRRITGSHQVSSCCYVKFVDSAKWQILKQGIIVPVKLGDVFSFLPERCWFKIISAPLREPTAEENQCEGDSGEQVDSGFSSRVVPAETESCIPDRIVTTSPASPTFSSVNMAETVNDSAPLLNDQQGGDRGARDARSRSPVPVNSRSNDPTDPVDSFTRENCKYGEQCYRKNVEHRREFSHPGDPDYDVNTDKPECPYGSRCYRKSRLHRMQYKHMATHCNYGYTRRRNAVAGSSRQRFSEESSDAEESVDESEYEPNTDDQDETTGDEKFHSDDSCADDHS